MLIKYPALLNTLKKRNYAVVVLIGNDPYLLNEAALITIQNHPRYTKEYRPNILDINLPNDWTSLIYEANHYSLFESFVILDARYEKKSMDSSGKALLIEYLTTPNEHCLLLLRSPQIPAKSLKWLSDHPNALVVQIQPLKDLGLKQWIERELTTRQIKFDPQVSTLIQDYTQGNMLATAQWIEKLALLINPGESVTLSMIKEQLTDQSNFELYDLTEACLEANAEKALRLLQQARLKRTEPTLILWVLIQEIRLLIQLKHLLKQSIPIEKAASELKIWTSRVRLYGKANSRLKIESLYHLLEKCQQGDDLIKSTQSPQIWYVFDEIIMAFTGLNIYSTLPN